MTTTTRTTKFIFVTGGVVSSLGKGIREFKGSIREIEGELKAPLDERKPVPPAPGRGQDEGPRRLAATDEEKPGEEKPGEEKPD